MGHAPCITGVHSPVPGVSYRHGSAYCGCKMELRPVYWSPMCDLHVRVWYVSTSVSVLSGFAHHGSMESLSGSRVHEKPRCGPKQASRPLRDFLQFSTWICERPLCVRFLRQLSPFQRCQWSMQLRIREICYLYCSG